VERQTLGALYQRTRSATLDLVEPLAPEDCQVQSMPDVSPTKWHLGHTSWFFETFVLERALGSYAPTDQSSKVLFNSYYQSVGARHPRPERGLVSRPRLADVLAQRRRVDDLMLRFIADASEQRFREAAFTIEVGVAHEEQHQELILTDIKHVLCTQPTRPRYRETRPAEGAAAALSWLAFEGGVIETGHDGSAFAFDNERPRHRTLLEPFALASRLVIAGEWLDFIADGGYARPELWLSDGWETCCRQGWQAPLYWSERAPGDWEIATLGGVRPVARDEPVCHVSYYEADAFARWAGARLPLESEWELAARDRDVSGNFVESGHLHPVPGGEQLFGDVWEWTASPYLAYPGYRAFEGALGEYNGKFMVNQLVLRGGSCVSPRRHLRATYRNFFPPVAPWQFSGLRLARSG
jgi:ergothioneine biosynthesis protein EgtB